MSFSPWRAIFKNQIARWLKTRFLITHVSRKCYRLHMISAFFTKSTKYLTKRRKDKSFLHDTHEEMKRFVPSTGASFTQTSLCMWSDKEINIQDIFTHLRSPDIEFQENCTLCVSFYLCPESTFKRRTQERENVAYKRANVAWERTNVANVACEFWFSPRIVLRIPYFASAQILPRGRNTKRIKRDRNTTNSRGKTVSLRGGCNGFDVKKRRRAKERETNRRTERKCLKIWKTHGCFRERPTWTQKPWLSRSFLLSAYFHPFIPRFFYLSPRQGEEGTPTW